MKFKLEKIKEGSMVCDPLNPKNIYKVIEKITVFDGFDLGYGYGDNDVYAYGETKRLVRCKHIDSDRVYRYPATKKMILLGSPFCF